MSLFRRLSAYASLSIVLCGGIFAQAQVPPPQQVPSTPQTIEQAKKTFDDAMIALKKLVTDGTGTASQIQAASQAVSDASARLTSATKTATDSLADASRANQAVADTISKGLQQDQETLQAVQSQNALLATQEHLSAVPNASNILKDHVPCLLDSTEIYGSRGMVAPSEKLKSNAHLTPAQKSAAIANLEATLSGDTLKTFSSKVQTPLSAATNVSSFHAVVDKAFGDATGLSVPETAAATDAALTQAGVPSDPFPRPNNVGCSMSIYSWNVARMVFGRTVADNYLAVHITVRNMDQGNEFLIHDAELAVDAYSGQLERFQASHEKESVRAVVVYGQNYDRRAVLSHGVEGIGMILGAIVGVPGGGNDILTAASGAYTAGFVPSMAKLLPDLSTQNLNNVNDLAFSAASSSRIVVPKGGSVPFVIFVPVRPLEQACWLQPGYTPSLDIGVGTACDAIFRDGRNISPLPPTLPNYTASSTNSPDYKKWPFRAKEVAFKHWSPEALMALEKHAYAVVAGQHIRELNAAPSLRSISCTSSTDDLVHIALLGTNPLTCTLMGADLDTVPKLRAQSLANPSSSPIDGTLTTSGDSTTGKAVFTPANAALFVDPSYELFAVDQSGNATDLKQQLAVMPAPTVTSFSPSPIPATAVLPLVVNGANLKQVTGITLTAAGETITGTVSGTPTEKSVTFTLSSGPKQATKSYAVAFTVNGMSYPIQTPYQ